MSDKTNFDLVLVVISSRGPIYDQFMNIYWIPLMEYIRMNGIPIKIILLFGKNQKWDDLSIPSENLFVSEANDSLVPGILYKTVECFKDIETKYNYKHVIRTNLSSFFIIDNLLKIQKRMGNSGICAGFIGYYDKNQFCSGAGIWLTQDVLDTLIKMDLKSVETLPDDVAISNILKQYEKKNMPRYDLIANINVENKKQLIQQIVNSNHYHIRIKNGRNRNLDIEYFKSFYDLLYK